MFSTFWLHISWKSGQTDGRAQPHCLSRRWLTGGVHLIQEPTAFRGGLGSALWQQTLSCYCAFVRLQAAVFSRLGRIAEERMLGAHSLLHFLADGRAETTVG